MTMKKLEQLRSQLEMLSVIEVDGIVEAFVLTIREDKAYDSVNYLWFSDHYDRFLYIDRVVVSVNMRSKLASRMSLLK